jgi:hypothetical protein
MAYYSLSLADVIMMGLPGFCNPNLILLDFQGREMFKFSLDFMSGKCPD